MSPVKNLKSVLLISTGLLMASPLVHAQHAPAPQFEQPTITATDIYMMGAPVGSAATVALENLFVQDVALKGLEKDFEPGVKQAVRLTYAQRMFEPMWDRESAEQMWNISQNMEAYGLRSDEQTANRISALIKDRFGSENPDVQARADLELSEIWLKLAAQISGGLGDEGASVRVQPGEPAQALLVNSMETAAQDDIVRAFDMVEPDHPQYKALKQELYRYEKIVEMGGWDAISDGETLEEGQQDPRVPALRDRLRTEGYDSGLSFSTMFAMLARTALIRQSQGEEAAAAFADQTAMTLDATTAAALKAFQADHGLDPDGKLGPATLDALNESAESKWQRIADSMQAWRVMGNPGERYVWANIPSFTVQGYNGDAVEIEMRSIVGMASRETPVFSDTIEYAVANPRWYAPTSIVRRDKLPKLAADPSYASRGGYSVIDRSTGQAVSAASVDWTDSASASEYQLIQAPGANNALGKMKIIFPNQYSVYLHGTPSMSLFERPQRALSSGCVRLEDPVAMASWLASFDDTATPDDVSQALEKTSPVRVNYGGQTPVHITYITVTTDSDGKAKFWRDVYDKERSVSYAQTQAPLYKPLSSFEMAAAR